MDMGFFNRKQRPVENITFIAMMVGFNALISLIATWLPFSGIFIMLLAPLTSAAVCLFCRTRYVPLYILSVLGISLAVTFWDIHNTVFYLIPAIMTGVCYGILLVVRLPRVYLLFFTAIVAMGFFFLSLSLIKWFLGGLDMANVLLAMIGRPNDEIGRKIFPLFGWAYSLAQVGIMHLFLSMQFSKLGIQEEEGNAHPLLEGATAFITFGLSIGLAFINIEFGYLFLGFGLFWFICLSRYFFPKILPICGVFLFISILGGIFSFAALFAKMPPYSGLILFAVPGVLVSLTGALNGLLLKKNASSGQPKEL